MRRPVSNAALGMSLLLFTEAMLFAGLISAYLVARAGAASDWPPAGQPRLPVLSTAVNTLLLLASAYPLLRRSQGGLLLAGGLGLSFVLLQGREWMRLLAFGLTATSSLYGAFFYTLVGAHGLHAMAGLVLLGVACCRRSPDTLTACSFYWLFVVALWPVLYALVYLL